MAFLGAAGLLAKPIRQLTQINSVIQRGLSASRSVFNLLDEKVQRDAGTHDVSRVNGRIEFEQVSFSYNETGNAINDVSFIVKPGQTIALVGRSGSGKSTIVSLIPRFYERDSGRISIDNIDVDDYKLISLRNQISLVTQQIVLFDGTIAENIAYGDPRISRDKIEEAAERAHARGFIDAIPLGLDTPVGDDGGLLSGGERQRIAIARALDKNSPILILDEATSALDSESEKEIQKALANLMIGRTTIIIAHRLSTIEKADVILVLDKGRIVESGSHSELLDKREVYYNLHSGDFKPDYSDTYQ